MQRRATKLVSSIRNLPYERRLKELDITTLAEKRQRGDLIQTYKIMHNIDKFDKSNRFEIVENQLRGQCLKYNNFKETIIEN